jgi:outer membrane protein
MNRLVLRLISAVSPLLVALAVLLAPGAAHAQMKIAIIDLQRAVGDTEDGLKMKSRLQELWDTRQSEYEAKEKDYGKAKDELEKLAKDGKTAEAELRKKYASLEKQALELQAQSLGFRQEMQKKQNELMMPILGKLQALVRQLATQEQYDLVLAKEAAPYFRADLEITDKVISMYNASAPAAPADDKKGKKKPAAAQPAAPSPDGPNPDAAPAEPAPAKKAPAKKK